MSHREADTFQPTKFFLHNLMTITSIRDRDSDLLTHTDSSKHAASGMFTWCFLLCRAGNRESKWPKNFIWQTEAEKNPSCCLVLKTWESLREHQSLVLQRLDEDGEMGTPSQRRFPQDEQDAESKKRHTVDFIKFHPTAFLHTFHLYLYLSLSSLCSCSLQVSCLYNPQVIRMCGYHMIQIDDDRCVWISSKDRTLRKFCYEVFILFSCNFQLRAVLHAM